MPQKVYVCTGCFKAVWVDFDHQGLDRHVIGGIGNRTYCGDFDEPEIWQKVLI